VGFPLQSLARAQRLRRKKSPQSRKSKKCQAPFLVAHNKIYRYLVKRKNVPGTFLGGT
jgi:hypothetical protein